MVPICSGLKLQVRMEIESSVIVLTSVNLHLKLFGGTLSVHFLKLQV